LIYESEETMNEPEEDDVQPVFVSKEVQEAQRRAEEAHHEGMDDAFFIVSRREARRRRD
jgi:hypothetical protein